jgi:uncharacterized protein (DUF433 family)
MVEHKVTEHGWTQTIFRPIFLPDFWKEYDVVQARAVLSANEAASVTGVPLKEVHRIVDAGLLEGAVENRGGTRVIADRGLVGLKLAHETADVLTPKGRRELVKGLLRRPMSRRVGETALAIDVGPIETTIRRGLGALKKARKMVCVDKGILGGTPCFKRTRIPVHDIAAMIANGDRKSAVLRAYPQLTSEHIDLAVLYARAYPRRGRPRRRPFWRNAAPTSSEMRSVGSLLRKS